MQRQQYQKKQNIDIDAIYEEEKIQESHVKQKKTRKTAIVLISLFTLVGVSIGVIEGLSSFTSFDKEETVEVEQTDFFDAEEARMFTIDGKEYTLPLNVSKMLEDGYSIVPRYEGAESITEVSRDAYCYISLEKDDIRLDYVHVEPPKREMVPVEESVITSISIDENSDFQGPYGIETGDSYKDLEKIMKEKGMGYDLYLYKSDDFRAYHMNFDLNDSKDSVMYMTIYCDDENIYEISMSYYD